MIVRSELTGGAQVGPTQSDVPAWPSRVLTKQGIHRHNKQGTRDKLTVERMFLPNKNLFN